MYPGKGKVTPDTLYPLFSNFPDLSVVCAHWGGGLPFYNLMPDVKRSLASVYFDNAASPLLYDPAVYRHVIGLVGAERVLFGTDHPLVSYHRALAEVEGLGLPGAQQALMLGGNARRLFGIPEKD